MRPGSTSATICSMRCLAASAASRLTDAMMMVPSSLMSIVVPVSSVIERIVAPPLPITSRGRNDLGHLAEDVHAALVRLRQRGAHDFFGDAVDLDIHLQRGNAIAGAGHLEVHVAEVILVAHDVGQH